MDDDSDDNGDDRRRQERHWASKRRECQRKKMYLGVRVRTCLHYCWHGVYVLFRADDDIDRVELDCRNVMETHALLCKLTNRSISKIHRGMKDE